MPVTATDVVNQAIFMIGDKVPPVTGNLPDFDSSAAGIAAKYLYAPCVAFVQRTFEWDASRKSIALSIAAGAAPLGFQFQYLYPTNGIEVWQIVPGTITDPNNPLPTNWLPGNAVVASVQKRVIWTNVVGAIAIYNNNPTEDNWDSTFREAVVRHLASEMAMAIAGRPETSQHMLETSSAARQIAMSRDG